MFVMLVGPSDDVIESKIVTGPNLKLQRGASSPLSPMLATPLMIMSSLTLVANRNSFLGIVMVREQSRLNQNNIYTHK